MRLATCWQADWNQPRLGWVVGDHWLPIDSCQDLLDWLRLSKEARDALLRIYQGHPTQPEKVGVPLAQLQFLPPVLLPPSLRDFYAFEQHVRNARQQRGLEMLAEWYQIPAFYFSNPASLVGHEQPVRKPPETQRLDYELELAVVIGREGSNLSIGEAEGCIAGFTIMNDWSARDLQRLEMKIGLGPAKSKDFATSLGPWLVTPDELEAWRTHEPDRGSRWNLTMTARVNGQEISRGSAAQMHWTFAELIAHASRNTRLQVGDVIGSGTVGTGCLLEFPEGTHPWLQPGDVVELEIEGIGVLRNKVE